MASGFNTERREEKAALLDDRWGNIDDVLYAPLGPVSGDESWWLVPFFWLTLPISLILGAIGFLCKSVFLGYSIGFECMPCGSSGGMLQSALQGRPWYYAAVFWRYMVAALLALATSSGRLGYFLWAKAAFGNGEHWFHGEGCWCWSYKDCIAQLKSKQARKPSFGCVKACTPDLFATNLLIFLPNSDVSDCEWAAMRRVLHEHLLDHTTLTYSQRLADLKLKIHSAWPSPKLADLNDKTFLRVLVSKSVFYMLFGVWVSDDDGKTLSGWRSNATIFILPRAIQRVIFNYGIRTVQSLRRDTVTIVQKYQLEPFFTKMNNSLPSKYQRSTTVELCDEILFVAGFAGIGGTCAAIETLTAFLQVKIPDEANKDHINFGSYDTPEKMFAAYTKDSEAYIREAFRLDPPVASCSSTLLEDKVVTLDGRQFTLPKGMLYEHTLAVANRDPEIFPEADLFKPERSNLQRTLTWNGAWGADDEDEFPRLCPGRYLSLDVVKVVINHALGCDVGVSP
mmetsp:Transcript_18267/g.39037  ORF Transcript_18267/g.39037 Transcript_18267/m.39037 type:complete len:510 (-) Transcript_18267:357-1886(-)